MTTSTPLWAAGEVAAATDGRPVGDWTATGVVIDSRVLEPGDLFVALAGPNHDGHDYVAKALDAGAAAAIIHKRPPGLAPDAPVVEVADTFAALQALGRFGRLRSRARIAAITGSVGKTGTKEALRMALAGQGTAAATTGNLNNHLGVPLSLARLPADADYGVLELGMNHAGEIGPLSRMTKPEVSIITTIAPVHLEFFDSVDGIADAKAEIFEGMNPGGTAILNRDNAHFPRLLAHARTAGIGRIWTFGTDPSCDARLVEASTHSTCSAVHAVIRGVSMQYSLPLPGIHWVHNSLAVLLAARALGADLTQAARSLVQLKALAGRGTRRRVRITRDGKAGSFVLIDESYNASPVAMRAALQVLSRTDLGDTGRRIAVLGDMLELGDTGATLHAELKDAVLDAEVDQVFACGPLMAHLFDTLVADVRSGDAVLVKGSLGSRMVKVVEALTALDDTGGDTPDRCSAAANGR